MFLTSYYHIYCHKLLRRYYKLLTTVLILLSLLKVMSRNWQERHKLNLSLFCLCPKWRWRCVGDIGRSQVRTSLQCRSLLCLYLYFDMYLYLCICVLSLSKVPMKMCRRHCTRTLVLLFPLISSPTAPINKLPIKTISPTADID